MQELGFERTSKRVRAVCVSSPFTWVPSDLPSRVHSTEQVLNELYLFNEGDYSGSSLCAQKAKLCPFSTDSKRKTSCNFQ